MIHFEPQLAIALGICLHFAPWRGHVHLDLHLPVGVLTVGTWRHGDADDPLGCIEDTEPGR